MANVCMAYLLWALGGWFGLHHFYLGRYGLWSWGACQFSYFCQRSPSPSMVVLTWRVLWSRLDSRHVENPWVCEGVQQRVWLVDLGGGEDEEDREAALEDGQVGWDVGGGQYAGHAAKHGGAQQGRDRLRPVPDRHTSDPSWLCTWHLACGQYRQVSVSCMCKLWWKPFLDRWEGGLKRPLLGCYLTLPAYLYGWSVVSWTTIIGELTLRENIFKILTIPIQEPMHLRESGKRVPARVRNRFGLDWAYLLSAAPCICQCKLLSWTKTGENDISSLWQMSLQVGLLSLL